MSKLMNGEKLGKSAKTKIGVAVGTIAVSATVLAVVLFSGEKSFRTIAVEEVNGTVIVENDGGNEVNAYEGMHLYSGDDVSVQQDSDMTMVLDMDKYVYAEPGTHFWLECEGTEGNSKTVIYMDAGSTLNRITDNLNEGELYQVDTPNSTMAVRGTVFRVTVYRGEDGLIYTLLEVFEGRVQVDLKTEEGEYNGISEVFGSGEAALMRGNSDFSEFVKDDEVDWVEEKKGSVKLPIAYKAIPQNVAIVLSKYIDDGDVLSIGKELLMDYTKLEEHKLITRKGKDSTCCENGYEEVWCEVCHEVTETIALPLLPHQIGEWKVTLAPTCEKTGTQQKVCTVCGTVCEEEAIKELGHQMGELQMVVNATCTTAGEQVAYCTICNKELQRVRIEPTGHVVGSTVTVQEASCDESGLTQTKCSVCGTVLSESVIGKTGHSWGDWETVSAGNCTTPGKEKKECSECGETRTRETSTSGHTMNWVVDEPATCFNIGLETGTCTVCGYEDEREIAMTDHVHIYEHSEIKRNNSGYFVVCIEMCEICEDYVETEKSVSNINGVWYCECEEEVYLPD